MPTYTIQAPDGKTYSIDGPAGATRDQVIAQIKSHIPSADSVPEPSTTGDVLKSVGRGLAKGAAGIVGLPGDVEELENEALNYVLPGGSNKDARPPLSLPTSSDIEGAAEKVTGPWGKPKTEAGRLVQSVVETVPTAAIGPESLAIKGAMALGGGLGSEAAGEVTEGTGYEPYARFLGGLLGGVGSALPMAEWQSLRLAGKLPTKEAVKDSSTAAYNAVAQQKININPDVLQSFIDDTKIALDDDLLVPDAAQRTYRALDKLEKSKGDIGTIMALRTKLREIEPKEGSDYKAAQDAINHIDTMLGSVTPAQVTGGDPALTSALLKHARASWRSYKQIDEIERAGELALHRSQAMGTGANYVNAVRQEVRKILDSDSRSRNYSKAAKEQMEKIVLGTKATNTARYAGKFAPSGPVSATTSILTGMAEGPGVGAVVTTSALLAKYLGKYLTRRQLNQLQDLIRGEAPIGRAAAAKMAAEKPNMKAIVPAAAARSFTANQGDQAEGAPLSSSVPDASGQPSALDGKP